MSEILKYTSNLNLVKKIDKEYGEGALLGYLKGDEPINEKLLRQLALEGSVKPKNEVLLVDLDVSKIKNFSYLFSCVESFNQDISRWDVSKGEDFSGMFMNNKRFDQKIGCWKMSNARKLQNMFCYSTFNQDISQWDVSNVDDFNSMFSNNIYFNQDISQWNVSNGLCFSSMFSYATSFNQNISNWNILNAKDISYMFNAAKSFNQDISQLKINPKTKVSFFLAKTKSLNQDLSRLKLHEGFQYTMIFHLSNLKKVSYLPSEMRLSCDIFTEMESKEKNFKGISYEEFTTRYSNIRTFNKIGDINLELLKLGYKESAMMISDLDYNSSSCELKLSNSCHALLLVTENRTFAYICMDDNPRIIEEWFNTGVLRLNK